MTNAHRKSRGFTLIEVVVAVACAALLLSAAYAALAQSARASARAERVLLSALTLRSVADAVQVGERGHAAATRGEASRQLAWSADPLPAAETDVPLEDWRVQVVDSTSSRSRELALTIRRPRDPAP